MDKDHFPSSEDIERVFQAVRGAYFPRWDRCGRWSAAEVPDLSGLEGYCDQHGHRILICPPLCVYSLEPLVIHEITHAICGGMHGKRFQARLASASEKARMRGDMDLVKAVERDLTGIRTADAVDTSVECAYEAIRDYVNASYIEYSPEVTFAVAMTTARMAVRMPEIDFLRRCPRARAVFDNEVHSWEKEEEQSPEQVQAIMRSYRDRDERLVAPALKAGERALAAKKKHSGRRRSARDQTIPPESSTA